MAKRLLCRRAAVANISRAFMTLKTHPTKKSIRLVGQRIMGDEKKKGYAEWQLLED